jgi:hypothetical protein
MPITIDQFVRIKIQDLVTGRQWLPDGWSVSSDRLRVHHLEWLIDIIPLRQGGALYYLRGQDNRRYRHILIDPTGIRIGTRDQITTELGIKSPYQSQHQTATRRLTTTQRRVQARQTLLDRLDVTADPNRSDIEFLPPNRPYRQHWHIFLANQENDPDKVMVRQLRGMRRRTWLNLLNRLRKLNGHAQLLYPSLGRKRRWRHRFQKV